MHVLSDTPQPDETPEPVGEPPTPPQAPEGDPQPDTPPVKGDRSDELTDQGNVGDQLGDFA